MGMIEIGEKDEVERTALAEGFLRLGPESVLAIEEGTVKKGDVLAFAEAAGMLAVKNTPLLIPHCHPIPVSAVDLDFEITREGIKAGCRVSARYRTGVEMEAVAGLSVALLTIWDTVKYLEKDEMGQYPDTSIEGIRIVEKRKGA